MKGRTGLKKERKNNVTQEPSRSVRLPDSASPGPSAASFEDNLRSAWDAPQLAFPKDTTECLGSETTCFALSLLNVLLNLKAMASNPFSNFFYALRL